MSFSRRNFLKMTLATNTMLALPRTAEALNSYGVPALVGPLGIHFIDSRYVDPGIVAYRDDNSVRPTPERLPVNLSRSFVCPIRTPNPILTPSHSLEHFGVSLNSIIPTSTGFRGWGFAQDKNRITHLGNFSSEDGINWSRLNLSEKGDHFSDWSSSSFVKGSIFLDKSGSIPLYRIVDEIFSESDKNLFGERFFDPRSYRDNKYTQLIGGTSMDGFRWARLPEPILTRHTDTQNIGLWDQESGQYFYFVRDWRSPDRALENTESWTLSSRRSIGIATGRTFGKIDNFHPLFEPDSFEDFGSPLYGACVTKMPEDPTVWIMFAIPWRLDIDEFAISMSASRNGYAWTDYEIIFEPDAFDNGWDAGVIYPHPNLFITKDGDYALPYTGFRLPHKASREDWSFGPGLLIWPKKRISFVSAKNPQKPASFDTQIVKAPSSGFVADLQILSENGYIDLQLNSISGEVLDSIKFRGISNTRQQIFDKISKVKEGDLVRIKVELYNSRLYSL